MTAATCPFCPPPAERVFHTGELSFGQWDAYPVSPGHALLVPRRHVATWWDATPEEQRDLLAALVIAREEILRRYRPDGFNVGMNLGAAAGQTVFHLHVHVIPRYAGDVPDPRGGVRHVIPAKANYFTRPVGPAAPPDLPHQEAVIRGGEDPFLPHLRASLDQARDADLAVAFVLESGVRGIIEHLRDLLGRGGRLRLVTGDYLGVTEPDALAHLLDLEGEVHLRVYEAGGGSFHPKAYLFRHADGCGIAYVGSSNLSATALGAGVEWNYRVISSRDATGLGDVAAAFEALFRHPKTRPLTAEWVEAYRRRRIRASIPEAVLPAADAPPPPPRPHAVQREALLALEKTRAEGNQAGLVVLATGLGKTWLAAFDSGRKEYPKVLFVAHRDEILTQALETFRRIRPHASLGRYTGAEKAPDADVLFASIQTLGKLPHLRLFAPDAFDYVVVDEFHHAAAATYRRLIRHFTPKFLLGLTATPERADGGDLLALCQENLVYRCDLVQGIERGLLCPFRYFGVPDDVDYTNIPWRSSRFDEEALTAAVATQKRAENVLEQYQDKAGERTLAFCCSQRHADFMAQFFRDHDVRAVAVHAGPGSAPRAASLEQLEAGQLDVVCCVDMFNEGVDLPRVDTVLMLRPTESQVIWLQQFGRGLRKAEDKDALRVIDYIGNHRAFLVKVRALFALGAGDAAVAQALDMVSANRVTLPPGCAVTYDLKAIDILKGLLRLGRREEMVEAYYQDFKERYGERPRAAEALHDGYDPRSVRPRYGSWLGFVQAMGDLGEGQRRLLREAGDFLTAVEKTDMTRSFKMVVLRALLNRDALPGAVGLDALTEEFARVARPSAALRKDVAENVDDLARLRRYLERNPVAAWTGGKGTGGQPYFALDGDAFRSTFTIPAELRAEFQELVAELVEWRLAAYLRREGREPAEPREPGEQGATRWRPYLREDIPPLFGLTFNEAVWNSGFVKRPGHLFLLVTLEKGDLAETFQYHDRFLGPDLFQWQSQNRTRRDSPAGRALSRHQEEGYQVHLFVRRTKKIKGSAAPFVYCGDVRFVDWEGDTPITVRWRLPEPVPPALREALGVPPESEM
jgi:superfamily II DNA or RNA helicase/diadenosine tetraphosphate (Ap4A) HIT family hydrolase